MKNNKYPTIGVGYPCQINDIHTQSKHRFNKQLIN